MNDNYEYIHHATDSRIAEMLDEITNELDKFLDQIDLDSEIIEKAKQEREIMREAAKRLRIPHHPTFYEEYFGECL